MHRLTISLEDELYEAARTHAFKNRVSLSKAIGDLVKKALTPKKGAPQPESEKEPLTYFDPVLGHNVSRGRPDLTLEMMQAAEDDEILRHLKTSPSE